MITRYDSSLSDDILVKASAQGDTAAFGALVNKHKNAVYSVALSYLKDLDQAEDVTQDVFLTAYMKLRTLHDPSKFAGWLRRMTLNVCHMVRRDAKCLYPLEEIENEAMVVAVEPPDDALDRAERRRIIREALEHLGEKTREAVVLFYIKGYSYEEMADFLAVPVNTIKARLAAGRKQLRPVLADVMERTLPQVAPTSQLTDRVMACLTTAGEINETPTWSPDGTMLTFPSNRGGSLHIWVMPVDQGDVAASQLTTWPAEDHRSTWSPDGTKIAFLSDRSGMWEVWVVPVAGGDPRQLTVGAHAHWNRTFPRWSPDSRLIAFTSSHEGIETIFVIPSEGGVPRPLVSYAMSDGGAGHPIWSPDGTQMAFQHGGEIWVVPSDGGKPRRLMTSERLYFWPFDWSPDGRHLLCAGSWLYHTDIWMVPITGRKPQHVFSEGSDAWPGGWSPDGKRIAVMTKEKHLGAILTIPTTGGPTSEIVLPPQMEVKEPIWWANGQGIYFSGRERGDLFWHIWSLALADGQLQ